MRKDGTPLRRAAQEGHLNIVSFLAGKGATVEPKGRDGFTALHAAAQKGLIDVAVFLVEKGATVDPKAEVRHNFYIFAPVCRSSLSYDYTSSLLYSLVW
jgi:ankyrin repeat protein